MTTGSTTATTARRRWAPLGALVPIALAAGLVLAGSAGVHAAKAMPTGSIDLAAEAPEAASAAAAPAMAYGGHAEFDTSVGGRMSPKGYVYVRVVCMQGAEVVYQWSSRDLDFAFPLVDQAGQGLDWPEGTAAECTGDLIYRIDGKRNTVIEKLDSTGFDVAGW